MKGFIHFNIFFLKYTCNTAEIPSFFIFCLSMSVASDLTDSWLFCTKLKQLCYQFVLKRITSVLKTSVNKALLKGFPSLRL